MRNILLLSLLTAAAASQAATLTLNGLALPSTGVLSLSGVLSGTYYAGPFSASFNGGPAMQVFCGDLLHSANYGPATSVLPTNTASMAAGYQQAVRIMNKYVPLAGNDAELNAAIQGGVWKSIYGAGLGIAGGTGNAASLAISYAAEDLSAYSAVGTYFDAQGANQSQLSVQAVPEPASMVALGVGALGLLRRRKLR